MFFISSDVKYPGLSDVITSPLIYFVIVFPALLMLNTLLPSTDNPVADLHAATVVVTKLLYDHNVLAQSSSCVGFCSFEAGIAAIAPGSSGPKKIFELFTCRAFALISVIVLSFSAITIYSIPLYVTYSPKCPVGLYTNFIDSVLYCS